MSSKKPTGTGQPSETGRKTSEIDAFCELRAMINEPETVYKAGKMKVRPLDRLLGEKYFDAKATRTICSKYGIDINELEGTSILWNYQVLSNKLLTGCAIDEMINWSGSRPNWKRRIERGIRQAIENNMIEHITSVGGRRLHITEKGIRILEDYEKEYLDLKDRLEIKRIENLIKKETHRINKEAARLRKTA